MIAFELPSGTIAIAQRTRLPPPGSGSTVHFLAERARGHIGAREDEGHAPGVFPGHEDLFADHALDHLDRARRADTEGLGRGPGDVGDRRRPTRPRLRVLQAAKDLIRGRLRLRLIDEVDGRGGELGERERLAVMHRFGHRGSFALSRSGVRWAARTTLRPGPFGMGSGQRAPERPIDTSNRRSKCRFIVSCHADALACKRRCPTVTIRSAAPSRPR